MVKSSITLIISLLGVCVYVVDKDDQKQPSNQIQEKKSISNVDKMALLEEIGALKGELREVLNEAENIRKKILSKMYGSQARKNIVDKIKNFITPAQELLDTCQEKEKNVCVTPQVIREAYANILKEERMRKYEEEKAKIEEQKKKEEEARKQQQQQSTQTTSITMPSAIPTTTSR